MKKSVNDDVCGEEIFFFEEEVNNFIDIARSTAIGVASKHRKDYEVLSRSVLARIETIK